MIDQTSRWFDKGNPKWSNNHETNEMFITMTQNLMNHRLEVEGHILLNDVYQALGFEATAPGSVLGWSQQVNNGTFIEFDFDFINMAEGRIALDFNVDGVVFHEIGRKP
jgi:hypothetical protein